MLLIPTNLTEIEVKHSKKIYKVKLILNWVKWSKSWFGVKLHEFQLVANMWFLLSGTHKELLLKYIGDVVSSWKNGLLEDIWGSSILTLWL